MNTLQRVTYRLAMACDGSPAISTIVVMLFYVWFNAVEAGFEVAIFGKRFEHGLDALFALVFMAYSAYAVHWCAIFNTHTKGQKE